ncbi:hypothetical protein NC651_039256 [Populus alba x Populus x berolinensis]|nr:hypothetical protein NC651_039256 [Populus alba x Populus x berolinensis]
MAAFELTVFQVILLFWSLITAESLQVLTRPGCPSSCGYYRIPFPFGMEEGCYLDERFKILCDYGYTRSLSSGVPKLTVNGTDLEVNYISVRRSTIEVMFPVVSANCVGKDRNTVVDLEGSPFVFSSEDYFIAGGCGNLALMNQNQSTIGGCVSICDENSDSTMDSCSGINCCQTRIPSFLKVFNVTMKGLDDVRGSSGKNECRYAFLSGGYYSVGRFPDTDSVPVNLDWGIDKRVFESLVKNGSFYNSSYSSTCQFLNPSINSTNQSSTVQCFCNPGFEGNPYLYGSCQEDRAYNDYRRKIKAKMAGIGVGVGFGALFLLIGLWWLYKVFKRKRSEKLKKKYFKRNGGLLLQEQLSSERWAREAKEQFTKGCWRMEKSLQSRNPK